MARSRTDLGLLALRVGVGGTLAAHGAQKLFGWFGGAGIEGTTGGMTAMGFHPPKASALAAGAGELGGGALMALGLATPLAGAAAAATMSSAAAVHKPAGFWSTAGGFEYNFVLAVTGVALAAGGPGHYSLDSLLGNRLNRPWMAAAALTGLGAAAAAVIGRRQQALAAAPAQAPTSDEEQLEQAKQAQSSGG